MLYIRVEGRKSLHCPHVEFHANCSWEKYTAIGLVQKQRLSAKVIVQISNYAIFTNRNMKKRI